MAAAGDADLAYGAAYPAELLDALDAPATRAAPGAVPEGAEPLAAPESLGLDAWALVWGNRLPDASVDRLVSLVVGDSYRTVDQGGQVCVVATFGTAGEAGTTDVMAALARWSLAAPSESGASVTQTGPTLVELVTCDPGPTVAQPLDATVVDDVLARQIARLGS